MPMWQIIGGCFAGIVTVGILWKMFDRIFDQLDGKVSKDTWDEHCLRIDQLLESGNREFQQTREALQKQNDTLADVKTAVVEIKTTLKNSRGGQCNE